MDIKWTAVGATNGTNEGCNGVSGLELNAAEGGKGTERERERVKMKDEIGEFFVEQLTEQGGFFLYTGMLANYWNDTNQGWKKIDRKKSEDRKLDG